MSMHDTYVYEIVGTGPAESLPDPALHPNRCHWLYNDTAAVQTWTAPGAPALNLVLQPFQTKQVDSNGTAWVPAPGGGGGGGATKSFRGSAITNASGIATFNLTPAGFAAAPIVVASVQGPVSPDTLDVRITAVTTTSATIRLEPINGPATNAAGVTVNLIAMPPGSQV